MWTGEHVTHSKGIGGTWKFLNIFYFRFLLTTIYVHVLCLVAQSCPTLCDPLACNLPGSSVHGDSPGKNTEVGCHDLLQGIFPIQGLNQGLLHCREILYHCTTWEALLKHGFSQRFFVVVTNIPLYPLLSLCYISS